MTTYTEEQARALARFYVTLGEPMTRDAALAWLRRVYPRYFKRREERAFLVAFDTVERGKDIKEQQP